MSVVYLYGFVPSDAPFPAHGLVGVGDAPVELLPVDEFSAVTARVDDAAYGEAALEERVGDVTWMAEQGFRHEQVVAWFVDHATIVPSRLLTLFTNPESLRASVGTRAPRVRAQLARFADRREWDLKVSYDAAKLGERLGALSPDVARLDREIADAAPGKRYLLEKQRADVARTEARAAVRNLALEILEDVRPEAEDVVTMPPPPTEEAPVVLNAALLVQTAREDAVRARVDRRAAGAAELGIEVRLTGPWAPYRFVDSA